MSRQYTIDGVEKCIAEWCKEYGAAYTTVLYRLKKGIPIKEALTTEPFKDNKMNRLLHEAGFTGTVDEYCRELGISKQTFYSRIRANMSLEESISLKRHERRHSGSTP